MPARRSRPTRDRAGPSPSGSDTDAHADPRLAGGFVLPLLLVVAVGLAVRILYVHVVIHHRPLGQDATWYALTSGPLSQGLGFLSPGIYFATGQRIATAGYPPGYPAFLALVTRLFDGHPDTFRIAGCFMGSVTVVLTGLVGRRVGGNRVGVISAAVVALLPSLLAVDGSVMTETLSVPLIMLATLIAVEIVRSPRTWRWLLLGFVLGVVVLTRADGFVLLAVLASATALSCRVSARRRLLALTLTVLATAVTVAPWIVRNDEAVHTDAVASISSAATVAGANCDRAYHGRLIGFWVFSCMNADAQGRLGEAEWSRRTTDRGLRYARDHVDRLPLVLAVRELRGFGLYAPRQEAALEAPEGRSQPWQLFAEVVWVPVILAAMYGVARWLTRVRVQRELGPLLGVVAGSILVMGIAYGNTRFRSFAEPVLAIAAVQAVQHLVGAIRRRGVPTTSAARAMSTDSFPVRRRRRTQTPSSHRR